MEIAVLYDVTAPYGQTTRRHIPEDNSTYKQLYGRNFPE